MDPRQHPHRPKVAAGICGPSSMSHPIHPSVQIFPEMANTWSLQSVLANPLAWTSLSIKERQEVLSLFPDMAHTLDADTDDARPNFETLMNDDSFRYDCAAYVDNLAMGRHDAVWLEDAWSAHNRRKAGEFDGWLRDKFVEDWAVEPPDDSKATARPEERRVEDGRGEAADRQKKGDDETESTLEGCQPQDEADNGDSNHSMGADSHGMAIL
ncbi:hypothetical protein J3458_001593 [Metarhizium acridum]|uniref:uncharacterized protein n=1 Tax=Metarhizium acridum TaxID=92637 RepID=UPI001C6AE670|nr:hypothetical protein J3458_001593 [Metarhizium acridum]